MDQTTFVPRGKPLLPPLVDPNTVDVQLKPFVETFNALSPENYYQGVIVNPITCLTDEIRDGQTSVDSDMSDILTMAPEFQSEWDAIDFDEDYDDLNDDLDLVEEHTDRLTSNLSSLAGIAQGALALSTIMNLLSNPCLGLDGFLGSITDKGKQVMNGAKSQISSMVNQVAGKKTELASAIASGDPAQIAQAKSGISGMINDVKDAMNVTKSAVTGFLNDAKSEVMGFANAMLGQLRQGLNELLSNLPKDPCLRGLLTSAVTGAAASVIK